MMPITRAASRPRRYPPTSWTYGLVAWLTVATGLAGTVRLEWDQPADGGRVDFYSVYQCAPTNAAPVKLGDTTNQFWLVNSYPTNAPVKWLVTTHRGHREGKAAEVMLAPPPPLGQRQIRPGLGNGNLVVNGGFEARAEGWQLTGDCGISASPGAVRPAEGQRCVVFNAGHSVINGVLSQTIETLPGKRYALSFEAGIIALSRRKAPQFLAASVRGATKLVDQVFTFTPATRDEAHFYPQTVQFVADTNRVTVTFRDASPAHDKLHLLLDDVKVFAQPD